jgi:hypothetical protein
MSIGGPTAPAAPYAYWREMGYVSPEACRAAGLDPDFVSYAELTRRAEEAKKNGRSRKSDKAPNGHDRLTLNDPPEQPIGTDDPPPPEVNPDAWFFDETKEPESAPPDEGNLHGSRINAADLDKKEFTPVEWLIESFLPQGLALLAGKSKIGKSWLVLDLALAIARGAAAFEKIKTVQCDVLYLCLEDNQRRLQKRMRALLGQSEAPANLTFALEWARMDDGGLERLEEYLDHHPSCRLVIIDTLAMVRGRPEKNEQPYERDYKDMGMFRTLAHRRNISVIIVHHTKKQEQSDIFDMISGTTGLQGAVDTMIVLARARGAPAGTLNITGRDIVDDGEFAVTFHKDTGKWEILGEASAIQRDTKQASVLNFLIAQGEPVGPGEIAAELHVSSGYVKVCLRRLKKDGFVENPAPGIWQAVRQAQADRSD